MIEKPIIKFNGSKTRKINNKIYNKLWTGNTNMFPIDSIIKNKIIPYSYFHHIERLMVVGNFMKLCLLDDTLIYKMYMEWTIDAFNWVMYGNVYGMVLNNIKIMTRNYIASSNYIFKMSDFNDDNNWSNIFDALYYNYILTNYDKLKNDYSLRYQLNYTKKLSDTKKNNLIKQAKLYLHDLYK